MYFHLFAVPARPRNFQAAVLGPDQIQLSWNAPEVDDPRDILQYQLESLDTYNQWSTIAEITGTKTDYLMAHLTPNTVYRYIRYVYHQKPLHI